MSDLTSILEAIIGVIAVVITVYVIPWLKRKTTAEQQAALADWVGIAVTAAEQIYKGAGLGSEKKAYVLDFLAGKGYTVDLGSVADTIDALIEASVFELKAASSA